MFIEMLVVVAAGWIVCGAIEFIRERIGETDYQDADEVDQDYEPTLKDIELIGKSREIVTNHFPDGVEDTLLALSTEARMEKVKQLVQELVDAYEIDVTALVFVGNKQMNVRGENELIGGRYDAGNRRIMINADLLAVNEGEVLWAMINTIIHECRHAFQHKATEFPEECGVDAKVALEWLNNFIGYISGDLDPIGYYYQPVEVDARNFAARVLDDM